MGDPKKSKKKYQGPSHPWQKARIEEEKVLVQEFGLKNKKELWRLGSAVKTFADQAKYLIAATGKQAELEQKQLFDRLQRIGLLGSTPKLDDVLSLSPKDMLSRRLQTLVFKKGFARSVKQARQFITHSHVRVGGHVVTSPSYIVPVAEEDSITFVHSSTLASGDHPERQPVVRKAPAKEHKKTEEAHA